MGNIQLFTSPKQWLFDPTPHQGLYLLSRLGLVWFMPQLGLLNWPCMVMLEDTNTAYTHNLILSQWGQRPHLLKLSMCLLHVVYILQHVHASIGVFTKQAFL